MREHLATAAVVLFFALGAVHAAQYTASVEYIELFEPQPVETGERIEVRELFWYGCPHCYTLEPIIEKWLKSKPGNAAFVRTPAMLGPRWIVHARAYYTFESLGVTGRLHRALFDALHKEGRRLNDVQSLADFAAEHGVAREAFLKAYESSEVEERLREAEALGQRYGIDGVPTIVIDGKYLTTTTLAGGYEELMRVVDFLIEKAATERADAGT